MPAFVIRSTQPAPVRPGTPDQVDGDAQWDPTGEAPIYGPTLRRRGNLVFVPATGLDHHAAQSGRSSRGKDKAKAGIDVGGWYRQFTGQEAALASGSAVTDDRVPQAGPSRPTSAFGYQRPPSEPTTTKVDLDLSQGLSEDTALVIDSDSDSPAPGLTSETLECPICGASISPPTRLALRAHRRQMGISHLLRSSDQPALVPPIAYGIKQVNRGWKMLEGQGWKEGRGLGYAEVEEVVKAEAPIDEQEGAVEQEGEPLDGEGAKNGVGWVQREGRTVPVRAVEKLDRSGIGMSSHLSSQKALSLRRALPSSAQTSISSSLSSQALFSGRQKGRRKGDGREDGMGKREARKRKVVEAEERNERERKRALLAYMNAD